MVDLFNLNENSVLLLHWPHLRQAATTLGSAGVQSCHGGDFLSPGAALKSRLWETWKMHLKIDGKDLFVQN